MSSTDETYILTDVQFSELSGQMRRSRQLEILLHENFQTSGCLTAF